MHTESPYPPFEPPPQGIQPNWWPINAGQQAALNCEAELLLYGGMSGGGKSDFLVGDAMQEYKNPALRGLIIRQSLGEMQQLNDRMEQVYTPLGARYRGRMSSQAWHFPAGGNIQPGYLSHDKHIGRYRGNPRSWLGVDESGLHPEHRIRQMIGWLAAPPETGLRVRGRLASNPGGIGQSWQMSVFLRNKCPVHAPASPADDRPNETSTYPGHVYGMFEPGYNLWSKDAAKHWWGARWSTDDAPVYKTVAFFPASLAENPLYDDNKRASLMSQTAAIRSQLLDGCWCNAEGLYFDFLRQEHVVSYTGLNEQWWWNHFIAIDYGYGNSSAAAIQFAVSDNGTTYMVRERTEKKMSSQMFAKCICTDGFPESDSGGRRQNAWVKPKLREEDPESPRHLFCVVDRANDQHHGSSDKSNYDIMGEVFEESGIGCIKWDSSNSMGNAQNLYNGLSNGALVPTNQVPRTMRSLQTRVIDDRRSVKKIHGDPLDDLYDSASGGWNTWISTSEKPDRIALAQEIEAMRKNGADDTTLARYSWQREQALRQKEQKAKGGVQLGGTRIGSLKTKR